MLLKQTWKNSNNKYRRTGFQWINGRLAPIVVILTGTIFMLAGIYRGEMDVVLRKAINICLECIGIG